MNIAEKKTAVEVHLQPGAKSNEIVETVGGDVAVAVARGDGPSSRVSAKVATSIGEVKDIRDKAEAL